MCSLAWLKRLTWNQEIARSNRATQTIWATSVPGARLSYKQQDGVRLPGCLPFAAVLPVRRPAFQAGIGGVSTRLRLQYPPADGFRRLVYETGTRVFDSPQEVHAPSAGSDSVF